jgi:hypothetical protein
MRVIYRDPEKLDSTIRTESNSALLQESLDTLSDYCDYYHLELDLDKCLQISFSRIVFSKISFWSIPSKI